MPNNVGGYYNHTLFWESMTPGGAAQPARDGRLAASIRETIGSFAGCNTMKKRGGATVAELDPGLVEKAALELWIIPPDRSMV